MRRILVAAVGLYLGCAVCFAQEAPEQKQEEFTGVRVRHAEIRGRVYIASEREGSDETLGEGVVVRVLTLDESETICETTTDANGDYELPMLDIGRYRLQIGRLKLELRIEAEEDAPTDLPKIIIVMLPKEMAY